MNNRRPLILLSVLIAIVLMGVSVFFVEENGNTYDQKDTTENSSEMMVYENVKINGKQSSSKQDIEYEYKVRLKNDEEYWLKDVKEDYKVGDEIEVVYPKSQPEKVSLSENNKEEDDSFHLFYFIPLILVVPLILKLIRRRPEGRTEN